MFYTCPRAQTTALAISALEAMPFSWLTDIDENVTIVDKATQWLRAQNVELGAARATTRKLALSPMRLKWMQFVEVVRGLITAGSSEDTEDVEETMAASTRAQGPRSNLCTHVLSFPPVAPKQCHGTGPSRNLTARPLACHASSGWLSGSAGQPPHAESEQDDHPVEKHHGVE